MGAASHLAHTSLSTCLSVYQSVHPSVRQLCTHKATYLVLFPSTALLKTREKQTKKKINKNQLIILIINFNTDRYFFFLNNNKKTCCKQILEKKRKSEKNKISQENSYVCHIFFLFLLVFFFLFVGGRPPSSQPCPLCKYPLFMSHYFDPTVTEIDKNKEMK